MAVESVTPIAGNASVVTIGHTPVVAVLGGPNGGFITNPASAEDQGFSPSDTPEPLYVSPVGDATLAGNGTTFVLYPGQIWTLIPGQTTPTSVNAPTSGHKFSVTSW